MTLTRNILIATISLVILCCGQRPSPKSFDYRTEYYAGYQGSADVDWGKVIPVYHYWREEEGGSRWAEMCENAFQPDSTERHYVQGNFRNMNHYVTVYDLVEVLFRVDSLGTQKIVDDEFVLWRLNQYDSLSTAGATQKERKESLKKTIDTLLDFIPNTQWDVRFQESLEFYFKKFYSRVELED